MVPPTLTLKHMVGVQWGLSFELHPPPFPISRVWGL